MNKQYCLARPDKGIKQFGFTLIELMVTVLIVAVLVTVAMPSYMHARAKSDRSIATADINDLAQALERFYTYNQVYSNNFFDLNMASSATYQLNSPGGKYVYTIGVPSTTAIGAVPQGATEGQSYVIYAKPVANKNRDTWTLSQNHLGLQQSYEEGSVTAVNGWDHF